MQPPKINPGNLYYLLGKSLCATQVLDYTLAHCIAIWVDLPADESRMLVESSLKQTFGQLLSALRKYEIVPNGFDARLERYRDERNWLVHRFYSENWEDIFSLSKIPRLIERISRVHAEATALVRAFDALNDQWFDASGLPREALEQEMTRRLDENSRQDAESAHDRRQMTACQR